jgi:hypothetical protein
MLDGDPLNLKAYDLTYKYLMQLEMQVLANSSLMSTCELETKIRLLLVRAIEAGLDVGYKAALNYPPVTADGHQKTDS